jgi:hypothetical protein
MPSDAQATAVTSQIATTLETAREHRRPYHYWLLDSIFPEDVGAALTERRCRRRRFRPIAGAS